MKSKKEKKRKETKQNRKWRTAMTSFFIPAPTARQRVERPANPLSPVYTHTDVLDAVSCFFFSCPLNMAKL
jgi:hypothetical protein